MEINFIAVIVASFVPLMVGFVYYHPKVLGTAWMQTCNLKEEDLKTTNMIKLFGVSMVLNLLFAMQMNMVVIHQMALGSLIMHFEADTKIEGTDAWKFLEAAKPFMNEFRTFGHGALHGFIASIFFALPILGVAAMFERKSGKYILINWGYWAISMVITGGIICAWTK
jgi:Protein of unknown function (DUF1761)